MSGFVKTVLVKISPLPPPRLQLRFRSKRFIPTKKEYQPFSSSVRPLCTLLFLFPSQSVIFTVSKIVKLWFYSTFGAKEQNFH